MGCITNPENLRPICHNFYQNNFETAFVRKSKIDFYKLFNKTDASQIE